MSIKRKVSYAQNYEDLIIYGFLKNIKNGIYVDVGASHPEHLSVTKFFYEKGWSGVNIEPDPKIFKLLVRDRPRDINVRVGISNKPGTLDMRQYLGDSQGLSTFSDHMKKENLKSHKYVDVKTDVVTLAKVLSDSKVKHIDFMKIDVEGYEYEVLQGNDWNKYKPKLICIESNHIENDWNSILVKNGYQEVFFDGLNKYYLSEESKDLINNFSYAEDVLAAEEIPQRWLEEINLANEQTNKTNKANEYLQADINVYKTENLRLQREIIEQKRIISLLKQLIKSTDSVLRHRIEKLNKPKTRSTNTEQAVDFTSIKTKNELHKEIRKFDINNYYTNVRQKDRTAYKVVYKMYDGTSKAGFSFGKKTLGVVRRKKHDRSK
jgi:FkbM family methyltransferase